MQTTNSRNVCLFLSSFWSLLFYHCKMFFSIHVKGYSNEQTTGLVHVWRSLRFHVSFFNVHLPSVSLLLFARLLLSSIFLEIPRSYRTWNSILSLRENDFEAPKRQTHMIIWMTKKKHTRVCKPVEGEWEAQKAAQDDDDDEVRQQTAGEKEKNRRELSVLWLCCIALHLSVEDISALFFLRANEFHSKLDHAAAVWLNGSKSSLFFNFVFYSALSL